ncbi:hypothetical protein DMA11_14660 [Marinilabiliaceae bacterium JC017]|nr:hypothetical protein DMA11_14660 [Marinilabiliaceae bacterium JC017]
MIRFFQTTLWVICFFWCLSTMLVNAQVKTESGYGTTEETYIKGTPIQLLSVNNKHGNVTITSWDSDSIKIESHIIVNSTNQSLAEEVLHQIHISKYQSGSTYLVKTVFQKDFNSIFPFTINYIIKLPADKKLHITNEFGDVQISDISGDHNLDLTYGKLHVTQSIDSDTKPSAHLRLRFVEAICNQADSITMSLSNSNLQIKNANMIKGESQYSHMKLGTINNLTLHSETDQVLVEACDQLSLTGNHVYCKVNGLNTSGLVEINNGHCELTVNASLKTLNMANQSAPTTLKLNNINSYTLHGEVSSGAFSHPEAEKLTIIKEHNVISFSGNIGNVSQSHASFILFNDNSDLTIKK